ncbi:MAG: hypothetical protein LBG99_04065 [Propionibacteriaceae bacterium]|jgi:hypothetical protein|nr:hypothetical protein [Propionibacteriaceae bacterium]
MSWVALEAKENLVSGTSKPLHLVMMFVAFTVIATIVDLMIVQDITNEAYKYRDSGASTFTVTSPGRVNGEVCDQLSKLPSIIASGAIRIEEEPLETIVLPRGPIASYVVSEGALGVFDVEDSGQVGLFLSSTVASTLGVSSGYPLLLKTGTAQVQGTYHWPSDGRRPGFDYAALIPIPSQSLFDECWVKAWPIPENIQILLRLTVNAPNGDMQIKTDYSQVNTTLGTQFTGYTKLHQRVTQHAPSFTLILGIINGIVLVWARRLELASVQHVGVSWPAQLWQLIIEHGICLLVGSSIVLAIDAVVINHLLPMDMDTLWEIAARVLLCGFFGVLLGTVIGSHRIKANNLSRYFKAR